MKITITGTSEELTDFVQRIEDTEFVNELSEEIQMIPKEFLKLGNDYKE